MQLSHLNEFSFLLRFNGITGEKCRALNALLVVARQNREMTNYSIQFSFAIISQPGQPTAVALPPAGPLSC